MNVIMYLNDISDLCSYHRTQNAKFLFSLLIFCSLFKRAIFVLCKHSFFVFFTYPISPLL